VRADKENKKLWRRFCKASMDSILVPMMGAGDGGVPIETVADKIIRAAVDYLRTTPDTTLKQIYFLAFRLRDKSACDTVLEDLRKHKAIERLGHLNDRLEEWGARRVEYGFLLQRKIWRPIRSMMEIFHVLPLMAVVILFVLLATDGSCAKSTSPTSRVRRTIRSLGPRAS